METLRQNEEVAIKDFSHYNDFFNLLKEHGEIPEGQMSFNEQLTRLSSMFQIGAHKLYVYDPKKSEDILIDVPLFEIENTKIKSRRIIKMGVYYFTLNPQFVADPAKALLFYNKLENGKLIKAHHPHINDTGTPCLGEFQRYVSQIKSANLIYIVKFARKFLATHYYRSTFHRLNDNYDVDIYGTLIPSKLTGEKDSDGNDIYSEAVVEKIRVMGWNIAHEIRPNGRSSSDYEPIRINSHRSQKLRGWLVTFLNRGKTFHQSCQLLRALIRDLAGTEIENNEIETLKEIESLARWGYYDVYQGGKRNYYIGTNILEARSDDPYRNGSVFIRIHLDDTSKSIISSWRYLRRDQEGMDFLPTAPYPGEMTEEEIDSIISNAQWPSKYKENDGTLMLAQRECSSILNDIKVLAKQLTIKQLRKDIKELGGFEDAQVKTNHTEPSHQTYTVSVEEIPHF